MGASRTVDYLAQLLAVVSHDLRSPLSAINVGIDALSDPEVDPTTRERYLAAMRRAVMRSKQVISELLEAAGLPAEAETETEAEGARALLAAVPTAALLEEVARQHARQAHDAGNWFVVEVTEGADQVLADREALVRALDKLVVNALHFAHGTGAVVLRAEGLRGASGNRVRIWVIDHGRGFPEGEVGPLFEEYWHGHRQDRSLGAGLALAVARGLAEAQGGSLGAQRGAGGGASFYIELGAVS